MQPIPATLSSDAERIVREVTEMLLDETRGTLRRVEDAVVDAVGEPFGAEPTVAEAIRIATRANAVHWLWSFAADPNARVAANLSPEVIGIARETLRW
ncbi:hypothetical protein, partial [Clavibacter michiganensis]|uniref:hypothetical protein n=1 Tax=Clavibacter michiganensis TaxID=28447 RepID=UPI00292F1993